MDVHREDVVDESLAELRKAFDVDSFRVRRLMVSRCVQIFDYVQIVFWTFRTFYMAR